MPTWAITDDTESIAIARDGVVIKNIDKDIVVLRIVPAGVGLNTTAIDQLYIEHDGEYSTQIPYNDVLVAGVSPSSVEDFRQRVATINNTRVGGSGSGLLPTIEITVDDVQVTDPTSLAVGQTYRVTSVGSGTSLPTGIDAIILTVVSTNGTSNQWSDLAQIYLTGTEFVWGRYDTSGNTIVKLLPRNTIDISQSDFFNLVDGDIYPPNGLVDGQFYLIHGNLGAGDPYSATIDHILIQAAYDQIYGLPVRPVSSAQAFVTSLGKYVPCQYDVINNVVSGEYVLWCATVSQTGDQPPTIEKLHVNISGERPTFTYNDIGDYSLVFTGGQLVSQFACDRFSGFIDPANIFIGNPSDSNNFILKTYAIDSTPGDGLLFRTTIKIIIQLQNL